MATATVTQVITTTIHASATSSSTNRATPQGGVFEGVNPTHYDTKNPIILFIIQAALVIILTRIIHFPLTYLRQPRVIAEVITGIILGPSIMGRIPGFSTTIFPTASMPAFSLVANLGLVLFLFLVGLEVDLRFLASNWRIALSVGAAGMALPFGLGAAIAWGLYHEFRHEPGLAPIGFGVYLLFIGVAMAITAFPVLCRILTSLKLLGTPVGIIVLSAGVGNDVVGWILLALCVALVNSGAGLTALWILLVSIAYVLFLVFGVRPVFIMILRRTGSLANGPTQAVVALTILLVLASSFFTGIIGIHAIFGAFMVGLICPHEGGFAIKLTEKIEDLVSVLFLPLYFALSGLNTNLGLLNDGITWAYVVGVCAVAFFGKIIGGTLASRLNGLVWRESLTIGCLMSCKGLVELIVLNIGLQARILSTRTFTIFVVMALVTTFATTPLTTWLYPPWYQRKLELWKQGKIDWDGNPLHPDEGSETSEADSLAKQSVARNMLIYLRLDGLSSLFTIVSLLGGRHEEEPVHQSDESAAAGNTFKNTHAMSSVATLRRPLRIHGLRLMELTERDSSVMKVSEIEEYASRDPIIKAFGTFGQTRDIAMGGQIAVVPDHSFAGTLLSHAKELGSDFVLIPWSETGTMSEYPSLFDERSGDPLANREFSRLAYETYAKSREVCHVGILIDKSVLSKTDDRPMSPQVVNPTRHLSRTNTHLSLGDKMRHSVAFKLAESSRQRLIVVYGGTPDDLLAVRFAIQLARSEVVDLKILNVVVPKADNATEHHDGLDEFDALRINLPHTLKERVIFADAEAGALETINMALREPTMGETLLIIGRGVVNDNSTFFSGSSRDDSTILGSMGTAALAAIRQNPLDASLLVIQSKKDSIDDNLKRQKSIVSVQ